jgi:hypothetical protein
LTDTKKTDDQHEKPVIHLFRTPENFNRKLRLNQFSRAPNAYFENIAVQSRKILQQKMRSGELKKNRGPHRGVPKVGILLLAVIGVCFMGVVYANWQGTMNINTTMRAPLFVPNTQIQLTDVWVNVTRTTIQDSVFTINTQGRVMQFTMQFYVTATFSNGTKTQDMTRLFNAFVVKVSDYSQNVTATNLLTPNNPPASFSYNISGDRNFRLLISYSSKNIQIGGTGIPLVMTMNYSFSGQ